MPEREPGKPVVAPAPETVLAPDRDRDLGLRGEELARASWLLTAVFVGGLAVLAAVLMTRRRQPRP